jgi:DNA-directed RNA polymerase subunit K/omega
MPGKMDKSRKPKINLINNNIDNEKKDIFINDTNSQNGGIIDKSDEEDNIYNENNSDIASDSERSDFDAGIDDINIEEIENDKLDVNNEIDDDYKSDVESDVEETEDVEVEEIEAEAEEILEEVIEDGEGDGCLYKFVGKQKNDDSDEEYDDENFDDDNKIYDLIVEPSKRTTEPILYLFERVRLLSIRAKQLSRGAKPLITNIDNLTPKEIAKKELEMKKIPLIIVRTLPNGKKEHWRLKELEIVN